jgi:glycosyltransferase involved in cell wall biosynthesis
MLSSGLRIGFINMASQGWSAGGQYLLNLLRAIRATDDGKKIELKLVLFPDDGDLSYQMLLPWVDGIVKVPDSRGWRLSKSFLLRVQAPYRLEGMLPAWHSLDQALRNQGINILFANDEYGAGFQTPLMGWIPDFQQVHLPELFSRTKIRTRAVRNRRLAKFAMRVILSSQEAFKDFSEFAPQEADKGRVVHFVATLPERVYEREPNWVCERYRLPEHYYYLPNQFWKHKNHRVVVEAVALSQKAGVPAVVACSGNPSGLTGTADFDAIMQSARQYGIEDAFRYLGIIPHDHLYALMRQSAAVLQPSYFEGWSTTVEEAKSLGKRLILSDIAVHREQAPPEALYFDPSSAQALAELLIAGRTSLPSGPDIGLEKQARAELEERLKRFGSEFLSVIDESLAVKNG